MSKKKNKKFKKSPNLTRPQVTNSVKEITQSTATTQPTTETEAPRQEKVVKDEYDLSVLDEKYRPIRKDVFKLMIVLASLAIIFIAIYVTGTKTLVLDTVGSWVYKISGIQTQ